MIIPMLEKATRRLYLSVMLHKSERMAKRREKSGGKRAAYNGSLTSHRTVGAFLSMPSLQSNVDKAASKLP
jgi:hypothetical protein